MNLLHPVLWLAALAALPAVSAVTPEKSAKQDLERLQGAWVIVDVQSRDAKVVRAVKKAPVLVIEGNRAVLQCEGYTVEETFMLDLFARPAAIDFRGDDDITYPAIYLLEGDSLKICRGHKERPKEFSSRDGHLLIVYKRKK